MAQSPKTSQKTPVTRKKTSGLRSRAQREWESRFPDPGTMEDLSADEMRRAIQELIFNVIKHSGAKKASVSLLGFDDRHILSVSDPGRGFDTEILNSPENKVGFGTAYLREWARAMGGSLAIESAPGKGTRFTLTVPCRLPKNNKTKSPE